MAIDFPKATRANAIKMDPDDFVLIFDPKHPLYDPRVNLPVDEAMVLNIMVHGVIEPIVVRRVGDKAEVVAGRQRVKAAREAQRRLKLEGKIFPGVMAVLQRGDEKTHFGVSVSENEHRTEDGIMAKAEKAARYLNMGGTEEEASVVFGVTIKTIRAWTALIEAPACVRKAVASGAVAASAAVSLSKLSPDEAEAALSELETSSKKGKKSTVAAAKKVVAKKKGAKVTGSRSIKEIKTKRAEFTEKTPEYRALSWVLNEREELEYQQPRG